MDADTGAARPSLLGKLGNDAREGGDALKRMWLYERRAFGLVAFDATLNLALRSAGALMAATFAVCSVLLIVAGLRAAVASFTDNAWWGDLLLALAFLSVGAGSFAIYRRHVHRSTLRGARRDGEALSRADVDGKDHQ